MSGNIQDTLNVVGRLERLPLTRFMKLLLVVGAASFFFDVFDLNAISSTLPQIQRAFQMTPLETGLVTSIGYIGMFIGSMLSGYMGDKLGRRKLFLFTLVIVAIGSVANAFVTNAIGLQICRFITGFGIGGDLPVVWTYLSEFIPAVKRQRYFSITYFFGAALSFPVLFFCATGLTAIDPVNGWRYIYFIGGLIGILLVPMRGFVPESPRYLLAHGNYKEADELLTKLENRITTEYGKPLPAPSTAKMFEFGRQKSPLQDLFRKDTIRRTVASCWTAIVTWTTRTYVMFVPVLLMAKGFTMINSLFYSGVAMLGSLVGPLICYAIGERIERRYLIIIDCLALSFLSIAFAFADNFALIVVINFLLNTAVTTSGTLDYVYTPELFPAKARSTGAGFSNGMYRLSSALGTFMVASMISGVFNQLIFISLGGIGAAAVMAVAGINTSRRTLEEISEKTVSSTR